MTFNNFWEKQREAEPGEPKYISLCKILNGSGEDGLGIEKIFDAYMMLDIDYNLEERPELLEYLFDISQDK